MNAIRNIVDVIDKKIVINLPEDFQAGKVEVIVLPYSDEEKIKTTDNLYDFFKKSPLYDSGIQIIRDVDTGREINL